MNILAEGTLGSFKDSIEDYISKGAPLKLICIDIHPGDTVHKRIHVFEVGGTRGLIIGEDIDAVRIEASILSPTSDKDGHQTLLGLGKAHFLTQKDGIICMTPVMEDVLDEWCRPLNVLDLARLITAMYPRFTGYLSEVSFKDNANNHVYTFESPSAWNRVQEKSK